MPVRTIYLIRHGQYDLTVPHGEGDPGGNLTSLGREQANFVAKEMENYDIHNIYCSTMPRATETAQIIAERLQLKIKSSDLLQESTPSIPKRLKKNLEKYMKEDPKFTFETVKKDLERSEKAYLTYFYGPSKKDVTDLIVCHGNIIRYFLCKVLDINIDNWIKFDINNCGISCVKINEDDSMQIIHVNETKHIPREKITFT